MQVAVRGNDVDGALRILKKKLDREGLYHARRLREIAKPSERRKEKERFNQRRKNDAKRRHLTRLKKGGQK